MKRTQLVLRELFQELIDKKHLGPEWALSKKDISELVKIRKGFTPSCADISEAAKELTQEFEFLMRCPNGYYFPADEKQWKDYTSAKIQQAKGLLNAANQDLQKNYNNFKTFINARTNARAAAAN